MKEIEEMLEELPSEDALDDPVVGRLLKAVYLGEFPGPDSAEIDRIFIDEKKKAVTIKFKDGYISTVKCCENDEFNIHYGVALAFLKAYYSRKNIVDKINLGRKKPLVKLEDGYIKMA